MRRDLPALCATIFGLLCNRATNCKGAIAPVNTMGKRGSEGLGSQPSSVRGGGYERECEQDGGREGGWKGDPHHGSRRQSFPVVESSKNVASLVV